MVKFLTALVAGSMLAFSSLAAAQLDFADVRLQVRQAAPSFGNSTTKATTPTSSPAPSATANTPQAALDALYNNIEAAILTGKNADVPFAVAQGQVRAIINLFRSVFDSLLLQILPLIFPTDFAVPLGKRADIDAAKLLPLLQQLSALMVSWHASPAYQQFLAAITAASTNFNLAVSLAALNSQIAAISSRASAAVAGNAALAGALSTINSQLSVAASDITTAAKAGSAGSATTSVSTVLTTQTIVVGATSTQIITICTLCMPTTAPGFTVTTKTSAGATVTVTVPCQVTYVPPGTTTKYYGGSTSTVTIPCSVCNMPAKPSLTTYISTGKAGVITVTEPCPASGVPAPAPPASKTSYVTFTLSYSVGTTVASQVVVQTHVVVATATATAKPTIATVVPAPPVATAPVAPKPTGGALPQVNGASSNGKSLVGLVGGALLGAVMLA